MHASNSRIASRTDATLGVGTSLLSRRLKLSAARFPSVAATVLRSVDFASIDILGDVLNDCLVVARGLVFGQVNMKIDLNGWRQMAPFLSALLATTSGISRL